INTYSDGSGGNTHVIPCVSQDQLTEELTKLIIERLDKGYGSFEDIEFIKKYNIKLSDDYKQKLIATLSKGTHSNIEYVDKQWKDFPTKHKGQMTAMAELADNVATVAARKLCLQQYFASTL